MRTNTSYAPPAYEDAMELRNQMEDVDEIAAKLQPLTTVEKSKLEKLSGSAMNNLVVGGEAWGGFRHNLRQFVFPTVKQYIQANVEDVLTKDSEIVRLACRVQCKIVEFCEQELKHDANIAPVLTISGRVKRAEAAPCGAYMRRTWPRTGEKMLDALQYLLKHNSCGKNSI